MVVMQRIGWIVMGVMLWHAAYAIDVVGRIRQARYAIRKWLRGAPPKPLRQWPPPREQSEEVCIYDLNPPKPRLETFGPDRKVEEQIASIRRTRQRVDALRALGVPDRHISLGAKSKEDSDDIAAQEADGKLPAYAAKAMLVARATAKAGAS